MIEKAVDSKKVFLVLDDIATLDQLDALLGSKDFHPGSKIIISTKETRLTECFEQCKTNVKRKHLMHKLQGLSKTESKELLCFHAFMCNNPKAGYEEVSEELVNYCEGHPMALKVLGRSLHNRDVAYWEGYIDRLKIENRSPINNILKMSFDSLPFKTDKDLFKHVACFFVGMDRDVTLTILEACDIDTRTGITNLIDKCLLSIGRKNKLMMHQLVQEMGRFLVREESPDKPWKRSRLWCHDSFKVLKQNKGTENVLGLILDMRMLEKEKSCGSWELKTGALSKMDSLMLLQLNYVQINGSYKNFPEELVWLCMHGSPLESIPLDLPMENLVALDMSYSKIKSFDLCNSDPQQLKTRQKLIESCSKDQRFLGSLKILNLSFCEQLCSVVGFDQLPALERLIVRKCIGLLDVCESIEQCVELVHVDLSYCNKFKKLPVIIGRLKTVKTLLLEGCDLGESQIELTYMVSTEKLEANNIGINIKTSSSTVLEVIPSYSKFLAIPLSRSLVKLSLANNNLLNESFPMDFSCLPMLEELYLDGNPLVSMPNCVRSLPRLDLLSMVNCKMLTSVEHPPPTLTYLDLDISSKKHQLRKVVFDSQMYPLIFLINLSTLSPSPFEVQGLIKIQPMTIVEEKVLRSLGWTKLDFLNERRIQTSDYVAMSEESEIQMYYEFGIFSTFYGGEKEMPSYITHRSTGPSMSFTIPSSPKKNRGLNFCCMLSSGSLTKWPEFVYLEFLTLPMIIISNITKNLTWIYSHHIERVRNVDGGCLTWLSHWMFEANEMECGDHVTITLRGKLGDFADEVTTDCGVSLVYDDGDTDEEEDALGYYKSWNHIIGGDLTGFQATTGEYILSKERFLLFEHEIDLLPSDYLGREGALFKEEVVLFKAFSQRRSGVLEDSP